MNGGETYAAFARVYDELMDNVDYPAWASRLEELMGERGIRDGLVLDLGCGTGTMTELLAERGYDMIGVDASPEMLMRALEKRDSSGHDILYLCQQMQEFELYGTVRAVVSVCDSLNYLLEEEELAEVFSLVHNYLDPGGLFLFDMNTVYKYRELLGDTTIAETREDASFIWENTFDEESGCNEYLLTLFLEQENGLYERCEEEHLQRAYDEETVRRLLARAGLEIFAVYDDYTKQAPHARSERILWVAGKPEER